MYACFHLLFITGRLSFTAGEQALMFLAGANSIFNGDKLLTTPNPEFDADTVSSTGVIYRHRLPWVETKAPLYLIYCFALSHHRSTYM